MKEILQEFVPRPESLLAQLTLLSFQKGPSAFFTDKIPFSFSTGLSMAHRLNELVKALKTENPTVLEFGCGLGLLAKNLLSINPDLVYHATEYHPDIVKLIQSNSVLTPYLNRLHIFSSDIENPNTPLSLDFLFLMYVLDTVPIHHFYVDKGLIFEVLIRTVVKKEELVLDSRSFPPKFISSQTLKQIFSQPITQELLPLVSIVTPVLEEETKHIPLSESKISDQDKAYLKNYVSKYPDVRYINYSQNLSQVVSRLLAMLPEKSCVCCYDFGSYGSNKTRTFKNLIARYGGNIYYGIDFQLIADLASQKGFFSVGSFLSEGESSMMLLCRGHDKQQVSSVFQKAFSQDEETAILSFKKEFEAMNKDQLKTFLLEKIPHIQPTVCHNYFFRLSLARACFNQQLDQEALSIAQSLIEDFGEVSVSAYHLISLIYNRQEKWHESKEVLEKALALAPFHPELHFEMTIVLQFFQEYSKLKDHILQCFKWLIPSMGVPWRLVQVYLIIELFNRNASSGKEIIEWAKEMKKNGEAILPEHLLTDILAFQNHDLFKSS